MTTKLLVRQGNADAAEVDYANAFTDRKGTPFFDRATPIIQVAQRFANGEAAQGYFKFVDPEGELTTPNTLTLRPWSEVKLTEDASGDEYILGWMRLTSGDVQRRDVYIGGDEIDHNPQMMDCNIDLRGIPLPTAWHRDAETDWDRLNALEARKLNGASSTEPAGIIRDSTDITIDSFANGHLVERDVETDLDARNYPVGTEVLDIIAEIAEQAGKEFAVVLHHTGGSTHKCLLYVDQEDLDRFQSAVRISDDPADWDPTDLTAPTFEPHWLQGAGKEADFTSVASGIISIWGGTDDEPRTVTVENPSPETDAETYWVVYNDADSTSETQATRRATWQLNDRKRPHHSYRPSILVTAAQAHLVTAGQAIETKSVVMNSGPDKDEWVWRRVTQCTVEPAADGLYWLHLNLERPRFSGRSGGRGQPASTSPKPAPECPPDTTDSTPIDWDWEPCSNPSYLDPFLGGTSNPWGSGFETIPGGDDGCGTQTNNNSYSDYIAVTPGDNLAIHWWSAKYGSGPPASTNFRVRYYDSGGVQIDQQDTTVLIGTSSHEHGTTVTENTISSTVPVGAAYMRMAQTTYSLVHTQHVTVVILGGDPVEGDEFCVDYGDAASDSPFFLPSDYVTGRLDGLDSAIGSLRTTSLQDVDPTDPTDGQVLVWDDTAGLWTPSDSSDLISADDVRDAGRWEVIVSGTAPPVAVTNVAEDDWVYGWVAG